MYKILYGIVFAGQAFFALLDLLATDVTVPGLYMRGYSSGWLMIDDKTDQQKARHKGRASGAMPLGGIAALR
jgi:hypothetical protein